MRQDVVAAGTFEGYHYVIYRIEPRHFGMEVFDGTGKSYGFRNGYSITKQAWADAIDLISAIYRTVGERH